MSKKVPVDTATTRRMPTASAASNTWRVPVGVDRPEGLEVLARTTEQRGAVDGGIGASCRGQHVVGVGDVPGHDAYPHGLQRPGVGAGSGQGLHPVAALDEEPADVGPGQSGGPGHEDGVAHDGAGSAWGAMAASTSVGS